MPDNGTVTIKFTLREANDIAHAAGMFALELAMKSKRSCAAGETEKARRYELRAIHYHNLVDTIFGVVEDDWLDDITGGVLDGD